MLHHYSAHRMVRHQTPQTATIPIQTGPDLLDHFVRLIALLRSPFNNAPHLPLQVLLLVLRGHPRIHHTASVILGRHYHIVASIGQLLDLKLRRQLASMVQARSRGLVETIEAAPSSQTDTTTNNIYN